MLLGRCGKELTDFSQEIIGVHDLKPKITSDARGQFAKFFQSENLGGTSKMDLKEAFVSFSKKGTLRGMHLQIGESASARIVYLISGEIEDVLVDLRRSVATFGNIQMRKLVGMESPAIFVPKGVAHGFKAISDSTLLYLSDKSWVESNDTGINPFSISYNWNMSEPIISSRDLHLPNFEDFKFI